ncbi:bifunctional phosphoribosyl-AMP cyclohydrolase/phosphoribosyl-ATP diphosphatase HisIE [Robiginitalea sp. M366]|uniref:bifunctional phosphoribosyl-AMP cyclohydrolase/phosphoribosyl-ATP diphosphatase HisIE n=1 Tax=Robiginitalea aestuariiviva TaxID=3036903 RepID=UPI00240E7086|nr:bifunctional phosphoribosyl-AMP cyclohydrolase/phosphoribosyl-ATP diphosphatase HisIE [Robiginitalea aestuariiviva]MDG1572958.1 bifunctional phosphoribosyl-AMP cyclohydrolase/phosphoribosyl-ATP diphosphatase HisIE [Robiginitalea aestuariiviva]
MEHIDFEKAGGLVPAIVQDADTRKVLMLGYMNPEALEATRKSGKVTFYSRSKNRLWTKGEVSGNTLHLIDIRIDCDADALLVSARPSGPVCHTGTDTCWGDTNEGGHVFLAYLESVIASRRAQAESPEGASGSYVASLFAGGINKIAQKVGEEAVETVIEAKDANDDLFLGESADLLFHYLILLQAKGFTLQDVLGVLQERHRQR